MNQAADVIDAKIKQIQDEGQKLVAKLGEIEASIKQADSERTQLINTINQYNGALQAYTESLRLVKGSDATTVDVAQTESVDVTA